MNPLRIRESVALIHESVTPHNIVSHLPAEIVRIQARAAGDAQVAPHLRGARRYVTDVTDVYTHSKRETDRAAGETAKRPAYMPAGPKH